MRESTSEEWGAVRRMKVGELNERVSSSAYVQ